MTIASPSLMSGKFARYVLPGIIVQSVLIGGGYSTGREVVQYGARYGAAGWIPGVVVFIGFFVMAFLMFEVSRVYQAYDYKTLVKTFIGPIWWAFDAAYLFQAVISVGVITAASGSIISTTMNVNRWLGIALVMVVVVLLNFLGGPVIQRFKTVGTVSLFVAFILFAALTISRNAGNISRVFSTGDTSYVGQVNFWPLVGLGIVYVGYNLTAYPAALFSLRPLKARKHSFIAGIVTASLMVFPWFLTYFAFMGVYPSKRVFNAEVPWLHILNNFGVAVLVIFGIVVGWTLVETATGLIHAFNERISINLEDAGKNPLTGRMKLGVTALFLGIGIGLSSWGVSALVDVGYSIAGYVLLAVYALPLLTIGSYLVFWRNRKATAQGKSS
ncbi:MAG: YkvI family membrane protein [Nocardioidaceae bacterium]